MTTAAAPPVLAPLEDRDRAIHPVSAPSPGAVTVTTDATAEEWDRYVEQHPDATPDHLWGWQSVFESVFGQACSYLVARRAGTIAGVLPLVRFRSRLFGRSVVSVPYLNYGGLLLSDGGAAAALLEAAREIGRGFGAAYVELRHGARQAPDLPYRQHKVRMRLALPPTPDELWKSVDRKIRNQVRKAQKEGLTTADGGAELLDEFYPVFATNMRDLGTPVYSRRLFEETLRAFPERARVFIVNYRGRAVAGSITVAMGETVLVPWASALRDYRHLCPNMLLYWSMLERAVAGGARVFDFGRSSTGAGTHQFKLQWGATETPLHWEYLLLTRQEAPDHGTTNPKFAAAIEGWKRVPLWLANTLGPRIVSHIP
jgi:serine/alanine adding enzyme